MTLDAREYRLSALSQTRGSEICHCDAGVGDGMDDDTVRSSPGGNRGSNASKGDKARCPLSSSDAPYSSVANHVPNVSDCTEHVESDEYLLVGEDTGEVERMISSPLTLLAKRVGIGMVMLVMVAVSRSGSSANLSCAKPDFCSSTCTPTIGGESVSASLLKSINEKYH